MTHKPPRIYILQLKYVRWALFWYNVEERKFSTGNRVLVVYLENKRGREREKDNEQRDSPK